MLAGYGVQFKRSFKRNDKPICSAVSQFLAHLINQQVADDMLAFEIAILLLDNPSGGSHFTPHFSSCGNCPPTGNSSPL